MPASTNKILRDANKCLFRLIVNYMLITFNYILLWSFSWFELNNLLLSVVYLADIFYCSHISLHLPIPLNLTVLIGKTLLNVTGENPSVFLPLQLSELSGNIDMASHFVSRHLIAADLGSTLLKKYGKVYTLEGISASISEYQVQVSWFTLS